MDRNKINEHLRTTRRRLIQAAVAWPKGSVASPVDTTLWQGESYSIVFQKPGKEAGRTKPNENDMRPIVVKDGKPLGILASFGGIIDALYDKDTAPIEAALVSLAELFGRAALMRDHHVTESGEVAYSPKEELIEKVESGLPTLLGLPIEVYLRYADAIALNEDVKYYTKPGSNRANGRVNNLLTYVHCIAVILRRRTVGQLVNHFSWKRGVGSLPESEIKSVFPEFDLET